MRSTGLDIRTGLLVFLGCTVAVLGLVWPGLTPIASAAIPPYYVRVDGSDASCDGTVGAADPGSGPVPRACAKQTIQGGIDAAGVGETVEVGAGAYNVATTININKANLTVRGAGGSSTRVLVPKAVGYGFSITAGGATLCDLQIEKTDLAGVHNLILVNANNATIDGNTIFGPDPGSQWSVNGIVSRAVEVAGGLSGLLIQNNTIHTLRQPAYINPGTTGSILNNRVSGTRGWVVDGAQLTITGNTWGLPPNQGAEIALLSSCNPAWYPDLLALSTANDNAFISGQFTGGASGRAVAYVDAGAAPGGLGSSNAPFQSLVEGVGGVLPFGTVRATAGAYAGPGGIGKAVTLLGPNAGISPNGGARVAEAIVGSGSPSIRIDTADPVVIDGMTFDGTAAAVDSYTAATQITMQHTIFRNATGMTFYFNAPKVLNFVDNYLTNLAEDECLFIAGNWDGTNGTAVSITDNVWENSLSTGMNLSSVTGAVARNRFSHIQYYAVLVANSSGGITVSDNLFDTIVNPDPSSSPGWGNGVFIYEPSPAGPVDVVRNTFVNCYTALTVKRTEVKAIGQPIRVNFNRIYNNTHAITYRAVDTDTLALDALNNWWGCNYGPGQGGPGCVGAANGITRTGAVGSIVVDASRWIALGLTVDPGKIEPNTTADLTADLTRDQYGNDPGRRIPGEEWVTFAGSPGSVNPITALTSGLITTSLYTAGPLIGTNVVSATVGNQTVGHDSVPEADLALTDIEQRASGPLRSGRTVTYTLTATNLGPDSVDAVITDTFPAEAVAGVACTPACRGSGPLAWDVSAFTNTALFTVALTSAVGYSGTLKMCATITPTSAGTVDPTPDNNTSCAYTFLTNRTQTDLWFPLIMKTAH